MKTIREALETPIVASYDVVIAGGGPAGLGAAYGAARNGASVLIVEQAGMLGGVAVPGMMSHWGGGAASAFYRELEKRSVETLDKETFEKYRIGKNTIDHEAQRIILFDFMEELGVKIQLHTFVSAVMKDESGAVCGVITESKSGREAIAAKVVIDCTGDGDVAARAGADFILGREEDNKMQPATLMFKLGGVDWERAIFPCSFESLVDVPAGEIQALGKKILPKPAGHVLLYASSREGYVVVNMTNQTNIDGTDVRSLTDAEISCARQMPKIVDFLREYAPGYEKCYIISASSNVGIRETRHIKGLKTITGEDILEAKVFDDWIAAKAWFNFDIHNIEGAGLDKNGAQKHFRSKGVYTIPYGACVPVDKNGGILGGLLVAGRCISGTHLAHSNYRIMKVCAGIGEGCGTAAALAVKAGVDVANADVKKVQEVLTADGAGL